MRAPFVIFVNKFKELCRIRSLSATKGSIYIQKFQVINSFTLVSGLFLFISKGYQSLFILLSIKMNKDKGEETLRPPAKLWK